MQDKGGVMKDDHAAMEGQNQKDTQTKDHRRVPSMVFAQTDRITSLLGQHLPAVEEKYCMLSWTDVTKSVSYDGIHAKPGNPRKNSEVSALKWVCEA